MIEFTSHFEIDSVAVSRWLAARIHQAIEACDEFLNAERVRSSYNKTVRHLPQPYTFRIGDRGPVRQLAPKRFVRTVLLSQGQVERAQQLYDAYVAESRINPFSRESMETLGEELAYAWREVEM